MPKANLYNMAGEVVGEVELSEAIFGIEPNETVLHAAIKNHLANCRQGTQSALTKGEVSYSTVKPWRQKGTGRARAGYKGSPVWTHGGVAFAPKPRDYSYELNRKVRRLALVSALSSKAADGKIIVDNAPYETIEVFSITGDKIISSKSVSVRHEIAVRRQQVYLVKVANNVYKIAVK